MLEQIVKPGMLSETQKQVYGSFIYPYQLNDEATLAVKKLLNFYIADTYQGAVLDQLIATCGEDEKKLGEDFYLSFSEIKMLQECGMTIGSHTENHPVLSKLSIPEQEKEIDLAADFFEKNEQLLDQYYEETKNE